MSDGRDMIPRLPAFGRLDDWFGLALIEPVRGGRLFAHYSEMAHNGSLATHIQAVAATRRAMSEEEKKAETADRRIYPVAHLKEAAADLGTPTSLGTRADGQPYRCAIIELSGTLMKSPSSTDDATSTVFARMQLRQAMDDDAIDAIVLSIDSPGGYVSGTEDLAAQIRAAAAAKPLAAYVEDLCASAAYWCACAAPKIFANNVTAQVGSIGVVMAFYEAVGMAGQMGLKPVVIATGKYKGMGFPGTEITTEQRAKLQASVDETMGQFVDVVAKGRGMKADAVKALATGEVYGAAEAQKNGLVDGIKSFQQCLAYLGAQVQKRGGGGGQTGRRAESTSATPPEGTAKTQNTIAGGTLPAAEASAVPGRVLIQGDAMSAPGKTVASQQELKAKLPKSNAEFREKCVEDGLSLEEAAVRFGNEQADAAEQAREKAKTIGVAGPVGERPGGKAKINQAARAALTDAVREIRTDNPGMKRNEAWKQACRENPELARDMVVGHNLEHGRKKQAAAFAEDANEVIAGERD